MVELPCRGEVKIRRYQILCSYTFVVYLLFILLYMSTPNIFTKMYACSTPNTHTHTMPRCSFILERVHSSLSCFKTTNPDKSREGATARDKNQQCQLGSLKTRQTVTSVSQISTSMAEVSNRKNEPTIADHIRSYLETYFLK